MRNRWLLCVFLTALTWGQAAPGTPPPAQPAPATPPLAPNAAVRPAPPADTSASVPATAAVLTVKGVCAPQPKPAAAKGAAAKPAAKTAAADCKTVITKAEFDTLLKAIPNASNNPQIKRNIANRLPQFIAWSNEAKKKGLDKTPEFAEMVKFARMQILSGEMQQKVQEDAGKISDADLAAYYKQNAQAYEQYSLERLYITRTKQADAKDEKPDEAGKKDEKLTDDQKKAKEAEEKAKQEENIEAMTKLAETLRARAAAGEDFTTLQKEAFDAAGMKIASPTVAMPNQRRTGLPPSQAAVFDLKPGEVSQVINDAGGHYIYKLKSTDQLSLDQVKEEIRRTLSTQRSREALEKVNNSFTVEKNEAYFGPDMPMGPGPGPRPPMQRMPPNMPAPQPQGGPSAQPPAAPSAQPAQPPAPKPN
jgi:hypothetical protein